MCTSTIFTATTLSLLLNPRPLFPHPHSKYKFFLNHHPTFSFRSHHFLRFPTSRFSAPNNSNRISWLSFHDSTIHDFGGWDWDLPHTPIPIKKTAVPTFLFLGIGTSILLLVAVIAQFSLTNKGFRGTIRSPDPVDVVVTKTEATDSDVSHEEATSPWSAEVDSSDVVIEPTASVNNKPHIINIPVDHNQQEALNVLKKLKIIDEDVRADEICSRREYARWLVQTSSMLERNPKYKINKAVALSGSIISAYEDVTVGDQDFDSIQALAEAGVVPSKLSTKRDLVEFVTKFYPERFISRRDLIDWRALLEYDFSMTGNQEILKTKLDLLDVREISSDKWPGLLMDMLAGDKSLLRNVFGQIRRLQPDKPSTIAQVAVALTGGQMKEAINNELLRIQTEDSSRQAAKEEIKIELLDGGEIQRFWAEKMEEEMAHALEVQQKYIDALKELELEKSVQVDAYNGYIKEKAAMDCQKQLLNSLKEEVNEMSEKLVSERAEQISEEKAAQMLRYNLESKKEGINDAKSLLEAEIEALRILRSWIEDEAKKSQTRLKVLEEVGRRWKWDINRDL